MSKYEPLERFLRDRREAEVPLTFSEIERILGAKLPPAAERHRAWWSNNPSNNVMTRSWLAAGFVSERVDLASRRLVFRRAEAAPAPPRSDSAALTSRRHGFLDRFRARLGGTVVITEGVDITEPTGASWDAER